MGSFSNYACDSGLRDVTDEFADTHRGALAATFDSFARGETGEFVPAEKVRAIFHERGMPLDPTWSAAALERAISAIVSKALHDMTVEDDEYEAGLRAVGDALDEYVEATYNEGEESGFEAGREAAYEDAYAKGKEDAEAEAAAPTCPACMAPQISAHADTGRAQCGRCSTEFALIDARTLALLRQAAHEPVTREQYLRGCGLESAPLCAGEER